jgi:phospholipase D3/4
MMQNSGKRPCNENNSKARAYLVESIPKGLEDLRGTPGIRYTEDVLVELTRQARSKIDLTAMYWNLLPDPKSADESGFSDEQFAAMGADTGRALFEALREAAVRGVRIRILESPGFSASSKAESATLRDEFPQLVEIFEIEMGRWYGGSGIMHQKLWIFDDRHIYLGSANMDWKSIMQVKEMGIAVENCPELAGDATRYFEGWCYFSGLPASSIEVFDPSARVNRSVPPWSALVPKEKRAPSPLDDAQYGTDHRIGKPLVMNLNGEAGGLFLTGCPAEERGPGRSYDGAGLVHTIDDARRSVCISVMDFAPVGLYGRSGSGVSPVEGGALIPTDTPVWWPSLIDAILSAVLTRKVYVRLLISQWAHTSTLIEPLLRSLQQAADAGRASKYLSAGQLEIKQFIIPGWDDTVSAHRKFPGHSRVNHTKYIVTDRRINVGTSNMTWDYFSSTAGCSFNTDHPNLVRTLQSVFDRDWASPYAYRLS